ncbi:MAG: winged helix-turn-helix domain-containing protein [Nodosilinea sp.]
MVFFAQPHQGSGRHFCFGPFQLQTDGQLLSQGQFIPLAPKQQAVLRLLVEAQGQLVTKDEILQRVWQDEEISDSSLTRCIHDLRQRLKVHLPGHNYIQTLYGRGYRINARVDVTDPPSPSSPLQPNPRLWQAAQTQPRVYEAYLEARYLFRQRNAQRLQRAIALYQQALGWDPAYAPAYVGLADCYACLVSWSALPLSQGKPLITAALAQAAALDPQTPGLKVMQAAMMSGFDWEFAKAEALFQMALHHQSNDGESLLFYARHLIASGNFTAALKVMKRVVDLDPLSPLTHGFHSFVLHFAGQGAASVAAAHRSLELDSESVAALGYLCLVAATQGDMARALSAGQRAGQLAPDLPLAQALYAYARARAGQYREVEPLIQRALSPVELPCRSFVAPVAAALGDGDIVAAILDQSWRDRCLWLPVICRDPRLNPVRNHPAVSQWLRRVDEGNL